MPEIRTAHSQLFSFWGAQGKTASETKRLIVILSDTHAFCIVLPPKRKTQNAYNVHLFWDLIMLSATKLYLNCQNKMCTKNNNSEVKFGFTWDEPIEVQVE